MTAPETIWIIPDTSGVSPEWQSGWYQGQQNVRHHVEYTRTDLTIRRDDPVLKQVMEALESWRREPTTTVSIGTMNLLDFAAAALQELVGGGNG